MRGALCKKSEKAGGVWAMGCAEDDDSRDGAAGCWSYTIVTDVDS